MVPDHADARPVLELRTRLDLLPSITLGQALKAAHSGYWRGPRGRRSAPGGGPRHPAGSHARRRRQREPYAARGAADGACRFLLARRGGPRSSNVGATEDRKVIRVLRSLTSNSSVSGWRVPTVATSPRHENWRGCAGFKAASPTRRRTLSSTWNNRLRTREVAD